MPENTGNHASAPKSEQAAPITSVEKKEENGKADGKGKGRLRKDGGGKWEKKDRGFFRRSDNPDVVYGRDFEEETTPIEQIMGEIGEVCIRGKVLSYEGRGAA